MNNLLPYCGLVDPRISVSDKDLPVQQSEQDRKEDGTSGSGSGSGPDQMTSPNKMVVSQIIPQEKDKSLFYQKEYATPNAAHVKPWWERIMSNKH